MNDALTSAIAQITGAEVTATRPMSGGDIAEVLLVELADGRRVVAKAGDGSPGLAAEGAMLSYLATRSKLPVPEVLHASDDLLVMSYIEADGQLDADAERDAAELIAALHGITAERFGFEFDTVIGGLHQPNPWTGDWIAFFREHRLLYMARETVDAGRLPGAAAKRIEALAARLGEFLPTTSVPSLIHGDLWGGNVLCGRGRIAGFIDPATYYADAEIELAFSTLFGTFGEAFFARYRELRPIAPGFFEERRVLYNLYPLLVHVRLFGGHYAGQVEGTLRSLGF